MTFELADGPVIAARYELMRPLRSGSQDEILEPWLALDRVSGNEVVLKRIGPAAMRTNSRCSSRSPLWRIRQCCCQLQRVDDGTQAYDVFEFLPGVRSAACAADPGRSSCAACCLSSRRCECLHAAGLAHGDIKSANVLLDADGLARLADFGSTQRIGGTARTAGSPYAMSPERHAGGPVTVADDIYAVGALLYELVSGHPPFYPDLTPARVLDEMPAAADRSSAAARRPGRPGGAMPGEESRTATGIDAGNPCPTRGRSRAICASDGSGDATPSAHSACSRRPTQCRSRRNGGVRTATALRWRIRDAKDFAVACWQVRRSLPLRLSASRSSYCRISLHAGRRPRRHPQPQSPNRRPLPRLATKAPNLRATGRAEATRRRTPRTADGTHAQTRADRRGTLGYGVPGKREGQTRVGRRRAWSAANSATPLQHSPPRARRWRNSKSSDRRRCRTCCGKQASHSMQAARPTRAQRYAAALRIDASNAAARTGLARAKVLDAVLRETALGARAEQQGDAATATAAYQRALGLDPATRGARDGLARLQAQGRR